MTVVMKHKLSYPRHCEDTKPWRVGQGDEAISLLRSENDYDIDTQFLYKGIACLFGRLRSRQ
jgi:hypothetical protein